MRIFKYRLQQEDGGDGGDGASGGDGGQGGEGGDQGGDGGDEAVKLTMEQYREVATGGDAELQKVLERYKDPVDVTKALAEAKGRIREGFKPEEFPAEGSDEDKAAWRERNGIPSEATAYLENTGDGIVIGEDDTPMFESFAEMAREANLPQGAFDVAAKWYKNYAEEVELARQEGDTAESQEVDDALSTKYGAAEYRADKNNVLNVLKQHMPAEAVEALTNGRLADGKAFFNDPAIVEGFIKMARTISPISTLVGMGNDPGASIANRLAEIQDIRKKDYDGYMKNNKLQAEELELIEAQKKLEAA